LSLALCVPLFVLGLQRWELFAVPASLWGFYFHLKALFSDTAAAAPLKSEAYKVKRAKTIFRACL
ncbi:hypothetical protein, partial [Arcticibacter sp.]|uniref:hypothetical protein n=1 Tax=Arcticibacter sp. TaxID=1872630 RepID=UPI00388EBBE9